MRTPCRCNRCRRRFTLARHPGGYVRPPRCPHCRALSFHIDTDEQKKRKRKPCHCDGLWFPHRPGSFGCNHYTGPRDRDAERYGYS